MPWSSTYRIGSGLVRYSMVRSDGARPTAATVLLSSTGGGTGWSRPKATVEVDSPGPSAVIVHTITWSGVET